MDLQLKEIDLYTKIGMQAMTIELLEREIQRRDEHINDLEERLQQLDQSSQNEKEFTVK